MPASGEVGGSGGWWWAVVVVGGGGHLLLLLLALLAVRRIGLCDQAAQRAVGGSTAPGDDKADKHVRGIAAHQDMHATQTHNTTHTPQNTHTHSTRTTHHIPSQTAKHTHSRHTRSHTGKQRRTRHPRKDTQLARVVGDEECGGSSRGAREEGCSTKTVARWWRRHAHVGCPRLFV